MLASPHRSLLLILLACACTGGGDDTTTDATTTAATMTPATPATTTDTPTTAADPLTTSGTDTTDTTATTDTNTTGPVGGCDPAGDELPAGIVTAWRDMDADRIQIYMSATTDTCSGLQDVPCIEGTANLLGFVVSLDLETQTPGVYQLSDFNVGVSALVMADFGNGCEVSGTAPVNEGEIEVLAVTPTCVSVILRNIDPFMSAGTSFDANGRVTGETC